MFDALVREKLKSYVYSLSDPRDNDPVSKIFYIGKGKDNRCYQHIDDAIKGDKKTEKLNKIREIIDAGDEVKIDIVRHGMTDEVASEVESALIDVLPLLNQINGHDCFRGIESAHELQIVYGAKELNTDEALLLIKINGSYNKGMKLDEVYKATNWAWNFSIARAKKAKYVLGVADGIVRGVFEAESFHYVLDSEIRVPKDKGRKYFIGKPVHNSPYLNCSTKAFSKKGARNSFTYINC